MKTTKRFLLTLAAILGMTGAWAQDAEEVAVTKTANSNEWTLTMPASDVELQVEYYTPCDLTLATGSDAHGTVTFTVGDETVNKACCGDVVTVSVTPAEGYSAKDVTVRAYTSWEAASEILTSGGNNPELVSDIDVTKQENGTWQFTMPDANVWVVVTYAKNLQDAWIQNIANQTYTGSAIEPTVTVMDGETALVLNTDYTVAYTNNTEVGEATVTVTGIGNYSGTATATFNIVDLKRITLTIPAKSYMARIDADKRQIEHAVAGVSLYSVKSVTNTEVELTSELSVIAAEMPYFIYNAGDTEAEVNIVVSSEDADNVDYDSDHFKGTLVDKTFTDEDMEEADHYVLSGGSFVWVKDAGVLSAGKCWIELPKSVNNARTLTIVAEGETTGIKSMDIEHSTLNNEHCYDLQGRRVNKPAKGLYIVNGKTVMIK